MRNILCIIVLLGFTARTIAQETAMDNAEIAKFKTSVNKTSQAINTIQSDFTQYKHLSFLSNDIITEGKMAFKAPNRVRWEYTKPFQYSVIFKDDKLFIDDAGNKSNVDIGSSGLFQKLNELIVNSVKGDLFHSDDFKMDYYTNPAYYKVIFLPKDAKIKAYIASFILLFDKKEAAVLEVKIVEPSNDFTRIVFENRMINKPLADEVFSD